jgi:hypothetical protein
MGGRRLTLGCVLPVAALRFGAADLAQRVVAVDSVRKTVVNFGLTSIASHFALLMNGALLVYYAPLGALVAWSSSCFRRSRLG